MRRSFLQNRRGGVAIFFGLALMPLALMAGGAVDFSQISRQKSALNQVADAGVLTALKEAREQLKQGKPDWQSIAEKQGGKVFTNNASKIGGVSGTGATINLSLSGGVLSGKLNYAANAPTHFLRIAGLNTINLKGSASATMSAAQYRDIHFVIDVSASMGIGATKADQQAMQNSVGCAVACHHAEAADPATDNLAAVRAIGATLRIDVVRKAVMDALAKIPNDGSTRVAIHSFSNSLKTVFPLSTNIAGAISATQSIDLTNENRQGGTNVHYSLNQLNNLLASAGNGLTASQPRGFVLLATDAVEDSSLFFYADGVAPPFARQWVEPNFVVGNPSYFAWGLHYVQAPDAANCSAIKAKGYTMMTLETEYLIPDGVYNPTFDAVRGDMGPAMTKSMTDCASAPDYYFHAESPQEIDRAVQTMVSKTVNLSLTH